jgi:hypothetical protein
MAIDPIMFAQNIMLLIAFLLVGGVVFVVVFSLWTMIRAVWWETTRRETWKRYLRSTRRADGAKLPVRSEGFCLRCNKWDRTVYVAGPGLDLCAVCYDRHWRAEEKARAASPELHDTAA